MPQGSSAVRPTKGLYLYLLQGYLKWTCLSNCTLLHCNNEILIRDTKCFGRLHYQIFRNSTSLLLKAAHCSEIFIFTQKATGGYKTEAVSINDQYRTQNKEKNILYTVNIRSVDSFVTKKKGPPSRSFAFYI